MILRCYYIGGSPLLFNSLVRYIDQTNNLVLVDRCSDPVKVKEDILDGQIVTDIIFMDVEMLGMSGLELATLMKECCKVIFIANTAEYALQSYEVGAIDYLLRSATYPRFLQAVQKAKRAIEQECSPKEKIGPAAHILVPGDGNGNFVKVVTKDILYIKAASNYLQIVMREKSMMSYCALETILKYLPPGMFVRVHKSFIVNISAIDKGCTTSLLLTNKEFIPIGRSYKKGILQRIIRK